MLLWGLREPVMPWCTDGPPEADLAAWQETTMSDWADRCHEQDGTVVIPHFPLPNGEPAALIATGRADAVEMIVQWPAFHEEYYGYLIAGHRLPLVGGTDKMSSEVPVGLYRTYAKVDADEFSYEAWCHAVREGRTFVTGGPILRFTVDGHEAGDVVRVPGGGSVTVEATVQGIFPIGSLELVRNGEVIAARDDPSGGRRLELREEVRIDGDSWLAVRSGGPRYFDGPIHRGPWIAGSSRTRHRCTSHAAKATGRASIPTGRARCSRRSRPGSCVCGPGATTRKIGSRTTTERPTTRRSSSARSARRSSVSRTARRGRSMRTALG